jgi:2-methylisocitrate lyase-like PEP mutase family enzyme
MIVEATPLPVSADLENGFGHAPEAAALTVRLAAEAGLVGCSIEDASGDPERPIYDFGHAVERVAAAVAAARALSFRFTLTARAENFLHGRPDLDDTLVGAVVERRVALLGAGEHAAEAGGSSAEGLTDAIVDRGEAEVLADRDAQAAEVDRLQVQGRGLGGRARTGGRGDRPRP